MTEKENEVNEIEGERPICDNSDYSVFDLSQLSQKNKLLYRAGKMVYL